MRFYLSTKRLRSDSTVRKLETQVLIIGGGVTGTGIARDLALRGVQSILVEQGDINAGTSGANHGLLHSGARYVSSDQGSARECRAEGALLKKMAPHCIDDTGGLFVAVQGDDEKYVADFPQLCSQCDISVQELDVKEARELEPVLSDKLIAAYAVKDASIDPFKLSLENVAQAQKLGSTLLRFTKVAGFQKKRKAIQATHLQDTVTGEKITIKAQQVVNATGAWAGEVAALAGVKVDMIYSKGSLLVTHNRIADRVVNRLRASSNADILVPGGTVSILGTTSIRIENLNQVYPTVEEVDTMVGEATKMIPILETVRFIRAYAGVRPLVGSTSVEDDRDISRSFTLVNHAQDGLNNFTTISGGKLTTYRLMAEKTADLVCRRLGVSKPCQTRTEPLPETQPARWTQAGLAPKLWIKKHAPQDLLLCECEMVPGSAVDAIVDSILKQMGQPNIEAIALRSRIGKGACQGTFCGVRVTAYLSDQKHLKPGMHLDDLKAFLNKRWHGQYPTLWDKQLVQSELMEALHCGLFGLEL
ncbi:MAG: anaerobic glycerol-3-phosphate dehydrogenase subunit A [Deltaproteobacteria bacterium]|nr:anaerobic glycerol-3-phosphate dehydrogenase subunit A [Deltaproteobacteria bacterium]